MSMITNLLASLNLGGKDDPADERFELRPNRSDFRRHGVATRNPSRAHGRLRAHVSPRPAAVPHPLGGQWERGRPKTADQQAADQAQMERVQEAYSATLAANLQLPEDERTAWVFPHEEQADRDMRAARRRGRQGRRAARLARR